MLAAGGILLEPEAVQGRAAMERRRTSYKEYELLKILARGTREKVCTREELLTQIWGYDFEGNDRVVDNHIKKYVKVRRAGAADSNRFQKRIPVEGG